jgi:Protein of unknown function (DUF2771)
VRRVLAVLGLVALLASVGTGVLVWRLTRDAPALYPEISAYSHGETVRVTPYRYCTVELTDCAEPLTEGRLPIGNRGPLQLSVPPAIAAAPWRLIRIYEDSAPLQDEFRRDSRLAVTIPTVDPHHGKLVGVVVQVPSKYVSENGDWVPHAEWSVRTVWT